MSEKPDPDLIFVGSAVLYELPAQTRNPLPHMRKSKQLSVFPPGHVPSFSSSSCPSIRNSLRPSRRCHTTDHPAPPTPPAGCEMSLQPGGTTSSSGCTHSSLRSDGRKRKERKKEGERGGEKCGEKER